MRFKTPQTITTFPKGREVIVYNYLTKGTISCSVSDIYWLTVAPNWTSIDALSLAHPQIDKQDLQHELLGLVDLGILLLEGSINAEKEAEYTALWELGPATAMFHFTALDNEFGDTNEAIEKQKLRTITDPSPALFRLNMSAKISLLESCEVNQRPMMRTMYKRRTNRDVRPVPISLRHLGDCLFSGLGITGFIETETNILPLKMTPSGGARNPFEAYVWVRDVEGLSPGIYHYSALQHNLERLEVDSYQRPSVYLADQEWVNEMPAIIFLVAEIGRTTWKYNDPNAYRVVLIEAGHIAQNIMLTCADFDLTACPTAALSHSKISELFGLKNLTQTAIYALAVGSPKPYQREIISKEVIRNIHLSET